MSLILYCPTNTYFPEGLTHCFGKKIQNFLVCCSIKLGFGIMLSDVVDRKQALLNNKTVNKNGYFPKGLTHGFVQKIQNFF